MKSEDQKRIDRLLDDAAVLDLCAIVLAETELTPSRTDSISWLLGSIADRIGDAAGELEKAAMLAAPRERKGMAHDRS